MEDKRKTGCHHGSKRKQLKRLFDGAWLKRMIEINHLG